MATRTPLPKPRDSEACPNALQTFAAPAGERRLIQILRPFAVMSRKTYSAPVTPPIGPAYLAATLEKAGWCVGIIDAVGEDLLNVRPTACGTFNIQGLSTERILDRIDPDCAILGVSMMFSQEWPQHRELIQAIRQRFPNVLIVAGGEHPTAMAEYVLGDCADIDYLVAGEGELTFLELVHTVLTGGDARKVGGVVWRDETTGAVVQNGLSARMSRIEDLPRPAWHLLPVTNYFLDNFTMGIAMGRNMPLVATRGCPYQCTFCSNPTMWTTRYVMRPVIDVVDEIEDLIKTYNANSIDFFDLTAIVKKEWILDFCAEIERRGISFAWQLPSGTRSEALDEETLAAIRKAGCSFLVYAPESGSPRTLKVIKKRIELDRIIISIRQAVAAGLTVKINTIIGFPHENIGDVMRTFWFAIRMAIIGVDDCNISLFSPYPGSELYRELLDEGMVPPPSDDFFRDLIVQFDMSSRVSYCRSLSPGVLSLVRVLGHMAFYGLAYTVHPGRLVRLLRSIRSKTFRPANLFEQRLSDLFARNRNMRKGDIA